MRLLVARHRRHPDSQLVTLSVSWPACSKRPRRRPRQGSVNEILVLQAMAYQAQGDRAGALATVERVLVATEPEGHVRLFLDEGEPMQTLLRAVDMRRVATSRAAGLLPAPIGAAASTQTALADPLSDRELEVLRLLDTSMSVPEIARELFVSPNTLRTHTGISSPSSS